MSSLTVRHRREFFSQEHRSSPRIRFSCPVRWNNGCVDRVGWARDASENSAGFVARAISAPVVGETIRLIFELGERYEWLVDEQAIVQRCDPCGDDLWEVGVRLTPTET